MDPAIWSKLPEVVFERICMYLPFPDNFRFQYLSKNWRCILTEPLFRQAYVQNNKNLAKNLVAIVTKLSKDCESDIAHMRVYESKVNKWFTIPIKLFSYEVAASDGSLLCCVSRDPIVVRIYNPLIGDMKVLPSPNLMAIRPLMVKLTMNLDTKCYEVLLVGHKIGAQIGNCEYTGEIWNSGTKVWSACVIEAPFDNIYDMIFIIKMGFLLFHGVNLLNLRC